MHPSGEQYELFLTLAGPRLVAAREALALGEASERSAGVAAALVPLAVDAALLGAEGLRELSLSVVHGSAEPTLAIELGLAELERAFEQLAEGDASGARVDEARLVALARSLKEAAPLADTHPIDPAPLHSAGGAATRADDGADHALEAGADASAPELAPAATNHHADVDAVWVPTLAEDMVAAFLDECSERTDALSDRLLRLEHNSGDRELLTAIFRDLHTLKGGSAFAGLTKMNRVAHRAEDLIGALQRGLRRVDRGVVDVLLEALDVLREIVRRARARLPIEVDVSHVLARLSDPSLPRAARPSAGAAAHDASQAALAAGGAITAAVSATPGTLRIDFEKVDQLLNLVGEVVLSRGRLAAASETQSTILREVASLRKRLAQSSAAAPVAPLGEELERLERVLRETFGEVELGVGALGLSVGQLRDTVMKLRMVPIARLFSKYQRTLRELAGRLGKELTVELRGADTELDKVLVERLEDPLLHLVRNAADHGIEPPEERALAGKPRAGRIVLSASQRGGEIVVAIHDDGRGLDAEKLRRKAVEKELISADEAAALDTEQCYQLIFRAGFSTAEQVSDVSGRGVGMDVVRDAITRLKGEVRIRSELGKGTELELSLPLTLAITHVLTARTGGEVVAIPLDAVLSAQTVNPADLERVATGTCLRSGGQLVQLVDLAELLGLSGGASLGEEQAESVVLVRFGATELALLVQQVLGRHEVVLKALGPLLTRAPCAAGAALIGERMVLVVDLADVVARATSGRLGEPRARARAVSTTRARVLVAEDSPLIRDAICRELTQAGFEVTAAEDGEQALRLSRERRFDAVSTDVMMPKLDGYELVRALRQQPAYAQVPIVMVTSKDARIDALKGYDAGADAYLGKPAEADELVQTLDRLLLRKQR